MNRRILAPFNVGDNVRFSSGGSGYKKGTLAKVTAIGYDDSDNRKDRRAWRVKISISNLWWSVVWFSKVKS